MTYLVMEAKENYAIVLDEAGVFMKVANKGYEVGQTVDRVQPLQAAVPAGKRRRTGKILTGFVAAAACCILMVTSLIGSPEEIYASIYMTINPEVRIDVNRDDEVVGLEGMNTDGDILIEGYEFEDKELEETMDDLIDRAIEMGFLYEGGTIVLDLESDDEAWIQTSASGLREHLGRYLEEKMTVTTEINRYQPPAGKGSGEADGNSGYADSGYADGDSGYADDDSGYAESSGSTYGDSSYAGNQEVSGESSYSASSYGDSSYSGNSSNYVSIEIDGDSGYDDDSNDDMSDDSDYSDAAESSYGDSAYES